MKHYPISRSRIATRSVAGRLHNLHPSPELLEPRIAPAAVFVNAKTARYIDIDGDVVTVLFSKAILNNANVDDVLLLAPSGLGDQLQTIDLTTALAASPQDTDVSFSIAKAASGDGLANVGYINATGTDLGVVKLKGDLGRIDAGDSNTSTAAVKLLQARSMGLYGLATQAAGGNLVSSIHGPLGGLKVVADVVGANIAVSGSPITPDGTIGFVQIGGSLIGGSDSFSGRIFSTGKMGPVKILGNLIGGTGSNSGMLDSFDTIAAVTIGGSVIGGTGFGSGTLVSSSNIGAVSIGGNLAGGSGDSSGRIFGRVSLAGITIGGSLLGGSGTSSGSIFSVGDIGPVKIAHDMKGGSGNESGKIDAGGKLGNVTIGGSLLGGSGNQDTFTDGNVVTHYGQIFSIGDMGTIRVGHDVQGSAGNLSAAIETNGTLEGVDIGGSLIGGSATLTGVLFSSRDMGVVKIGHDFLGGTGISAGVINANGNLAGVTIGGSFVGGSSNTAGYIVSVGDIGFVKIKHDLLGGTGDNTGEISSGGHLTSLSIGGSLVGGPNEQTGFVFATGGIDSVKIGGDLRGGNIDSATTSNLFGSGAIESFQRIGSVFIGGSIITGADTASSADLVNNASIRSGHDIGSLVVKGSLIGNVGPGGDSFVIISASTSNGAGPADLAIGSINIGGRVEYAQIFAGYETDLSPKNADAQIGSVKVGGDWAASSIVAGAVNFGADDAPGGTGANADNVDFGNLHDAKITGGIDAANRTSKIGSITIAGQAFGSPVSNLANNFGFVAEAIGAVKIDGSALTLNAGTGNDGRFIPPSTNMTLHEIGALFGSTVQFVTAAQLVNAKTVAYTDIDGDHVTVKLSQPVLTAGNVNDVFKFDNSSVGGPDTLGQQLQLIDLTSVANSGLSVTVTVKPGGGDSHANVGAIIADVDLGSVIIPGDLGKIVTGDTNTGTQGLAALNVRTLGRLGVNTQPAAFGMFTPSLESDITGRLGLLTVEQDIARALTQVNGAIGAVDIGGSLIGGEDDGSGAIFATQIGAVRIGGALQGGVGSNSGVIGTGTGVASVTIGGSLLGGAGGFSGRIVTDGTIGPVKIAGDLAGGVGERSGLVEGSTLSAIMLGGSLLGGADDLSGELWSYSGDIGQVKIAHNVIGGSGNDTGKINAGASITSLKIGGSLIGGQGSGSGEIIFTKDTGRITVAHDVLGGSATFSGQIQANGKLAGLAIGGSLIGGSASFTGQVQLNGEAGAINIGHNVLGGSASFTGQIQSNEKLANLAIGGSLIGGPASFTGQVQLNSDTGPINIGHNVLGGSASFTGQIQSNEKLASLNIGGSLVGGSANFSGTITGAEMNAVKIGGDLLGSSIAGTAASLDSTGYIQGGRIAAVSIGGSVISGIDDSTGGALTKNASIRSADDIGTISVKGDIIGNATANGVSPVIISAGGQATPTGTSDIAIGKISIGGSVERALILAGYDTAVDASNTAAAALNGNAQIGLVTVGGDWLASSLVAGVKDTNSDGFGNADDVAIESGSIAKIASILIRGVAAGSGDNTTDHFGFVSHQIGSFTSLGFRAPLTAGTNIIELSPVTGDVTIREV
ncbi:beta strand repeat-containing protein [Verrucomicrobiota bacterium sgz303538]